VVLSTTVKELKVIIVIKILYKVFCGSPHMSFVVSAVSFHVHRIFCVLKSTDNAIDEDFDLAFDLAGLKNEIVTP
jgi:hypothetical protein